MSEDLTKILKNYINRLETEQIEENVIDEYLKVKILKKLKENKNNEIKELTKHANPLIKIICESLVNKNLKKYMQIFLKFSVRLYEEIGFNIFFDFNGFFKKNIYELLKEFLYKILNLLRKNI